MIRVNKQRLCPICEKPDWCMVAEDKSAAICARVSEGATKRVGDAGWLHVLCDPASLKLRRTGNSWLQEDDSCRKMTSFELSICNSFDALNRILMGALNYQYSIDALKAKLNQ